ncbi:MAG TPA: HAD-IIIA family hydrolase [Candidatus Saccharimonadia bacterium]|jgi:CDP-diacylglycerol--glycerol-3-phosphate 3-phosphatidyltransferase
MSKAKYAIVMGITALRVVLAPAVLVLATRGMWGLILGLVVLGFLSDFVDGWLARYWKVTSPLGAFLDPLADKIICLSLLVVLAIYQTSWYWTLLTVFVIYDVTTVSMRLLSSRLRIPPTSWIAKVKTALLMIGLTVALMSRTGSVSPYGMVFWVLGLAIVAVAAGAAVASLGMYLRRLFQLNIEGWLELTPAVTDINFRAWHDEFGIRAVLFDVDGTLAPWGSAHVSTDVVEAVEKARSAGITNIGLVSNMSARQMGRIEAIARTLKLKIYRIPSKIHERKPSPAMVHAAMKDMRVEGSGCAFIGDKLVDVVAGKRAGVRRIAWVNRLGTEDHPIDKMLYRPIEYIFKRMLA